MTLQLAVIASSVVGGLLFFFGGYVLARSVSPPLPEALAVTHHPSPAVRENSAVSPHGSGSVADVAPTSPEFNALREELITCRSRLAMAEREQGRIAGSEKELQQRLENRNKLEDENRQLHDRLMAKEGEADILSGEKSDLKRRLQRSLDEIAALNEQVGLLKELEVERNQLTIKIESLDRQVTGLERYKEESARLTTLVAEIPHLRDTVGQLKQENRELRSLGLAYQPPTATTHTMPAEHFGGSMQNLLERFAESKGARGAALADEHGLLIAGTSDFADGLAVTSALCDGLMTQLADILPLSSLRQLVIVDSNSITAAVYPFRVGPVRLMLASLSVGHRPGRKAIEDFVSQASRLIDGERSQLG